MIRSCTVAVSCLCVKKGNELPNQWQRLQFPVRFAYSITINKSQGQTFDRVAIYLPEAVFSHGQLYAAFSKAREFQDVLVKVEQTSTQGELSGVTVTQNVVYSEVL